LANFVGKQEVAAVTVECRSPLVVKERMENFILLFGYEPPQVGFVCGGWHTLKKAVVSLD
jgi:hypothetical protein